MAGYPQAPRDKDGLEWSTDLCDCFADCDSCCLGFWCPCVLYGTNVEKLTGEDCFCPCLTFYALQAFVGCSCCVSGPTRRQIRSKYQLKEAPCSDNLLHCFCTACALCQERRELTYQLSRSAPAGAAYAAPQSQQMHKVQTNPGQGVSPPQQGYPTYQQQAPAPGGVPQQGVPPQQGYAAGY